MPRNLSVHFKFEQKLYHFIIFTYLVDLNGFGNLEEIYTKCSVLNIIDFRQPSTNNTEFDIDINPENHIYNSLNNTCTYFTPE